MLRQLLIGFALIAGVLLLASVLGLSMAVALGGEGFRRAFKEAVLITAFALCGFIIAAAGAPE